MKDCNQCGKCCIKYGGGGLSVTPSEIDEWAIYSPHLLDYVKHDDGTIWVDPKNGQALARCPFLRQDSETGKYLCDIYFNRPDDCKYYPSTLDEMVRDDCEMLEVKDKKNPRAAQLALNQLMADSHHSR